jgi:hypothetical protein
MTKTDQPATPVTDWENDDSKGMVLCAEDLFREHIERTKTLRDRQAAYLDSLPTDPPEAIRAAIKLMHPSGDPFPDGFEEALHLTIALEAMVKGGDVDVEGVVRDATLYIANNVTYALMSTKRQLDLISDILSNPSRKERTPNA